MIEAIMLKYSKNRYSKNLGKILENIYAVIHVLVKLQTCGLQLTALKINATSIL